MNDNYLKKGAEKMVLLKEDMVELKQHFNNKESAIRYCGEKLVQAGCVDSDYIEAMIERDHNQSVYMGNFIAIPHGTDQAKTLIKKSDICVVQVPEGVNFGTEKEEKIVTLLFGIAGIGNEHLRLMQKIALLCSDIENVAQLSDALTKKEIIEKIENEDQGGL